MKTKTQVPQDKIKAYLQVAKERLGQVFFTRPEWRKPKSVGALNVIISRINEVYYPFSDKKNPKLAVWKQALREKREEMIAEIEDAKETQENKIKASGVAKEPVRLTEPGLKESPAALPPANTWTKGGVAALLAEISARRVGAKIARKLEISQSYLSHILRVGWMGKKGAEYLGKIKTELSALAHDHRKFILPGEMLAPDYGQLIPTKKAQALCRNFVDLPQTQASLISSLDVQIKDGKLHVNVVVDAAAAFAMYKERLLSVE